MEIVFSEISTKCKFKSFISHCTDIAGIIGKSGSGCFRHIVEQIASLLEEGIPCECQRTVKERQVSTQIVLVGFFPLQIPIALSHNGDTIFLHIVVSAIGESLICITANSTLVTSCTITCANLRRNGFVLPERLFGQVPTQ